MPEPVSENPTIEALMVAAAKGEIANIHTCLPGIVASYDPLTQLAVVQPTVVGRRRDEVTGIPIPLPFPPISNVPVIWPANTAGTASLTMPIASGTVGLLFFAERSVDEYLSTANPASVPIDLRRFDMTDAFFMPGGRPDVLPLPTSAVDPVAVVLQGLAGVKLGNSLTAIHTVLHGETFEADLATLLVAWVTYNAALAAATTVAQIATAATAFAVPLIAFQTTVTSLVHQSLIVKSS